MTAVAPQVGELCRAADGCCLETDGGGVTENADFNACFEESAVGIEGLAGLVGGGGGGGGEEEMVVAADSDAAAAAGNLFNDDETSETTTTDATPASNSEISETTVENEAEDDAKLNDGDETVPATAPATDTDK